MYAYDLAVDDDTISWPRCPTCLVILEMETRVRCPGCGLILLSALPTKERPA